MKKFNNLADDGKEKAIRHGYSVPPGAVNVAWTKAPSLSPKNNTIIIDTSKASSENAADSIKHQQVAYGNYLGILEDINGNQLWDDEYPIISDIFLPEYEPKYGQNLVDEDILPFVHVSRHFHVDFAGLVSGSTMEEYNTSEIKVVDRNGVHYTQPDGLPRYQIYLSPVSWAGTSVTSRDMAYRVYIFIDMDPKNEELYLKYNKVEINANGSFKNQETDYIETVNVHSYFQYVPEESDVVDHTMQSQKIYSTKPANMKQKSIDLPQNNYQGWNIFVPRKAVPDPRLFQLFRWRLACEMTRTITPDDSTGDDFTSNIRIRVGVIVPQGGTHLHTRANFLFYQLNNTDYNFSKIKFYNPLKSPNQSFSDTDQKNANYWHVDISTVTMEQLANFDVLIWAPTSTALDVAPYIAKINHFVENVGGTLIIETSSNTVVTGINGLALSPRFGKVATPGITDYGLTSTMRLFDATATDPNDTFSSYGMWKTWPPNVSDILTKYDDIGSILTSASTIAGWDLTTIEKTDITAYNEIPNMKTQYISAVPSNFKKVTEALKFGDTAYYPTMIHKKFNGGGNIFISTGSFFEDHLFEPNGDLIMSTMNLANFGDLANTWRLIFNDVTSSLVASAEMKLRINTMMLATIFKPSPSINDNFILDPDEDRNSYTAYTPWYSSWVINAGNEVLDHKEIDEFDFVLRTKSPTDLKPIWQRKLSSKTVGQLIQEQIKKIDPNDTNTVIKEFNSNSSTKRYFMIVTNPNVEVPESSLLKEDSAIMAWTDAYSPRFEAPYYLGPYKIRDEMIAGTGVGKGKRIYPPKSFGGRVSATYLTTSNEVSSVTATVKMTATVSRDLTIDDPNILTKIWTPGTTTVSQVLTATTVSWKDKPMGYVAGFSHQKPMTRANGIETFTDVNYTNPDIRTTNWAWWGRWGYHAAGAPAIDTHNGNRGENVLGIQRLLNIFISKGFIPGPLLTTDSYYGSLTAAKVKAFQVWKGAHWIDGIVDSETWGLLGYTLRGIQTDSDWPRIVASEGFTFNASNPYPESNSYNLWAWQASIYLDNSLMSDEITVGLATGELRQSWYRNGPPLVCQTYLIRFNSTHEAAGTDGQFRIFNARIQPWGNAQELTWLDVGTRASLAGITPIGGYPGVLQGVVGQSELPWQEIDVSFPERRGNSISFTLKSLGQMSQYFVGSYGTSRRIGIRDASVDVRYTVPKTTTTAGYYTTTSVDPGTVHTITKTDTLTYQANFIFKAGQIVRINPMDALKTQLDIIMADEPVGTISSRTVSSIKWNINSVQFLDNAVLSNYFDVVFTDYHTATLDRNDVTFTFNGYGLTTQPGKYIVGPWLGINGQSTFYSKTTSGIINPHPQKYGWVSKDEGIKLLCDATGKPTGFPIGVPAGANANMHFANYVVDPSNTDQMTYFGLYDNSRKEWIVNAAGDPEMSYYDYVRRGPLNVYMGVMTTYELDISSNLPNSSAPISRPFKWAMPVYGVTSALHSQLQLMPLNSELSSTDIWPIAVKAGRFSKSTLLRPRSQGSLTGVLKEYQGTVVNAFYSVPEAGDGPWSKIYGRPYTDVVNEAPMILDDNIIQVRQYPILTVQEPTATPSFADPWVPILKVEIRQSLSSPWVETPLYQIKDYNLIRGTITLSQDLPSNDARLVRVTYTSEGRIYNFKHDGITKVNLNPYISMKPEWQNVPLYVYVVPKYVTDKENTTITGTNKTRTLNITTSTSIFSPSQSNYDPLAIMLGVVYITTAFNLKDLTILDTRRRGGGVTTGLIDAEAINEIPESDSFWDIVPTTATSYQKGGYAIIRLPREVVNRFDSKYVIGVPDEPDKLGVIARNLTAGVGYKLQTLEGDDLEWPATPPTG